MAGEKVEAAGPMGFQPKHPGVILASAIKTAGISKAALAEHLRVSRQTLYQILNGERGVTADVAVRLGRAFGNSSQFWLNLQVAHDAWAAEARPENQVARLVA